MNKEDYNNEPVTFCGNCLKLGIQILDTIDYCDNCGSTEQESSHIEEWEKLYIKFYGKTYLTSDK